MTECVVNQPASASLLTKCLRSVKNSIAAFQKRKPRKSEKMKTWILESVISYDKYKCWSLRYFFGPVKFVPQVCILSICRQVALGRQTCLLLEDSTVAPERLLWAANFPLNS